MQEFEIELGLGDVIRIGECVYTVIDIEHGEVSFKIDHVEDYAPDFESILPGNYRRRLRRRLYPRSAATAASRLG